MKYSRIVKIWLLIGLGMLFVQVIVGGITRLTGSGLSITKWEIVTGTLPPSNEKDWNEAFDLYKGSPQYKEINEGMEMGSVFEVGTFKFIYFWEYIHRFWAKIMGFVFLIPFIVFWLTGRLDPMLKRRLIVVFLLAGLAASFGWIMVASGLVNRPWVNAYKLALHLGIAFMVYAYLFWTYLLTRIKRDAIEPNRTIREISLWFVWILAFQIFIGGVMSGMKAGVFYPTWPDMNGEIFPHIVANISEWNVDNFNNYDQNMFVPALIQLIHRSVGYVLFFLGLYFVYRVLKSTVTPFQKKGVIVLVTLLIIQVILGIITLINCVGNIPVLLGVLHQGTALLLLTAALFMNYNYRRAHINH